MAIFNYEILNPVTDKHKPYYDYNMQSLIFTLPIQYKYYLECARYNEQREEKDYFLLMGNDKFDTNCRPCRIDNYNRYKIRVKGELKDYIIQEMQDRGNLNVELDYEAIDYDVYKVI